MMRLCVTAANPSAANLVDGLLSALATTDARLSITLLAQQPAYSMLNAAGLPEDVQLIEINAPRHPHRNGPEALALSVEVQQRLASIEPQLLICGLSGPDLGVDEWAVHHARESSIPSLALQDYPGWVVDGIVRCADIYLVESEAAAEITLTSGKVGEVEVIGSLRLAHLRRQLGERISVAGPRTETLFFGQPLWHLDGYLRTLRQLAALHRERSLGEICYRPHPLESQKSLAQLPAGLVLMEPTVDYQSAILRCRFAYSCFSTALNDVALSAALSRQLPEQIHFLLFERDICSALEQGGGRVDRLSTILPGSRVMRQAKDMARDYPPYECEQLPTEVVPGQLLALLKQVVSCSEQGVLMR